MAFRQVGPGEQFLALRASSYFVPEINKHCFIVVK